LNTETVCAHIEITNVTQKREKVSNWTEVTDEKEIAKYNRELNSLLQHGTEKLKGVRIGYPNGSFDATVHVNETTDGQHTWMYSGKSKVTDDFITLVGRYVPEQRGHFLMDLQFNFHDGGFSRQKGGAFVKDDKGQPYLAHRGIVTKGSSRVNKASLLRFLNWQRPVTAESEVAPGQAELLVVAALDDSEFVSKVARFAEAVRDAATLAVSQPPPSLPTKKGAAKNPSRSAKPSGAGVGKSLDIMLSEYRDEFNGTRTVTRKGMVQMKWTHGSIVKALRAALKDRGDFLQSKATDLVVKHGKYIDLYEVKSSSASQSIYTAIGQLVFNGYALQSMFRSYAVRTFLVLPGSAENASRQERCKKLGFYLVTFEPDGASYKFNDLPY
jgi:hypothetical protein